MGARDYQQAREASIFIDVRLVDDRLIAVDLQLDQFIVGPLCFIGIGEGAERRDLEQAETKCRDAPVV